MGVSILLISLGSMGGIGLLLSVLLVMADKKLAVADDPKVEKALEILPGANCGACGFPQCAAYLAAIMAGKVSINECKPGGAEVAEKLSWLLGIEESAVLSPQVARVFCSGGIGETVKDKIYRGVESCAAAHLVGGEKACLYSCLGYGDCVEACPFEAMYMNENGLPVVDLARCTGCGECVKACPRDIIGLTGYGEVVHVYCKSRDKGALTRKICTAGCIACKLCEKDDDTGAVKILENLAVINLAVNNAPVRSIERCPTKVIRISEPVPGHEISFAEKIHQGENGGNRLPET